MPRSFARLLLPCLLLLVITSPAAAEMPYAMGAKLQNAVDAAVFNNGLPGASVAVRSPEGDIWYGQQGFANLADHRVWIAPDAGGIGSITKTFTATAMLQAMDRGLLTMDQTVEEVLPGLLSVGDRVTLYQLATMQSGLAHYETNPTFRSVMDSDPLHQWSLEDIARLGDSLDFAPGDHFDYNNGNFFIMALALEKVTGQSWWQTVREDILAPLGLQHTGLLVEEILPPSPSATGYRYTESGLLEATHAFSTSIAGPSGAMYSTAGELLTWMAAVRNGWLLSEAAQDLRMTRAVTLPTGDALGLGIAFRANGAMGWGGNLNDVYTGEWETYRGWDIAVLANGESGPDQNWRNTATGVYYEIYNLISTL